MDYELIETLVLKEISGDISPSESAWLREALESDAGARKLSEEIRNKINAGEVSSYLLSNDKNVFTQEVIGKIRQHKKRQSILRVITVFAAASLIILVGFWYFSLNQAPSSTNSTIASDLQPSANIILHLPDGKTMSLDSTDQKLRVGGITIRTQSRVLSYIAGSGAAAEEYATLTVPAGKDYKVHLKDGSEIHLNAATKLRFPLAFEGSSREITIDGEAYLKVAHDGRHPFIVHLPQTTIEVLGTEFNVNTYDTGVERISLVLGALKVKTPVEAALLRPGTEAVNIDNDIKLHPFDADEVLAWRQGMYYINNATFTELSAVLSRWYGCTVIVDTKEAAMQRFTGVLYRNKPVDLMLKSIQLTNTIHYSTDEKGIIHIR